MFTGVLNVAPTSSQQTLLIELSPDDMEYITVEDQMQGSIREHKDNCGGVFNQFNIIKVILITLLYASYSSIGSEACAEWGMVR